MLLSAGPGQDDIDAWQQQCSWGAVSVHEFLSVERLRGLA